MEKLELRVLGEWIELGRKLRHASDEEISSFIRSVETYLEGKVNDETLSDADSRDYVQRYGQTALNATRATLRRGNSGQLG